MIASASEDQHGKKVVREYRGYGAMGGGALGLMVAVVAIGPNLALWSASTDLVVVLSCAIGGAVFGCLVASLAKFFSRGGGDALSCSTEGGFDARDASKGSVDETGASSWDVNDD